MEQAEQLQEQANQIMQFQEQLGQLMPVITLVATGVILIMIISSLLSALRRRRINKAILETKADVQEIKALLQKQSSSYLSNVAVSNTEPNSTPSSEQPQK